MSTDSYTVESNGIATYACPLCGTQVEPYNKLSLHGYCPTCEKAVKLVEVKQAPVEEPDMKQDEYHVEEDHTSREDAESATMKVVSSDADNEDDIVMKFFDCLLSGNFMVTLIGVLIGVIMLLNGVYIYIANESTTHATNGNLIVIGFGVIVSLLIDYFIWEFFILTAKGMYRNLSIVRKNVEKLTENVEIVR